METRASSTGPQLKRQHPKRTIKSLMDERQQVIEEYIASLRDFMKSILRKMN